MIKRIILLFLTAAATSACSDIYYESETRLIVEGRLVDKDGQPVPAQYIDVMVTESDIDGQSSNIISFGHSDASGNFRFAIPAPRNTENFINVRINPNDDPPYQTKQFLRIGRHNFNQYRFNLNTVTIYKRSEIASLGVTTERTDDMHYLEKLTVEGIRADSYVAIVPEQMDYIPDYYQFEVAKDQTVNLKYTIADFSDPNHPVRTDYNIPIAIGNNESYSYTLTY